MGGPVVVVIQARLGSERLPGKILRPLAGVPMLDVLARRIRGTPVARTFLATTDRPEDSLTEAWGEALGFEVYRGSEDDVLSRFLAIGRLTGAEWLIRLTADNPLVDRGLLKSLLKPLATIQQQVDSVRTNRECGLPLGYGAEAVRTKALERSASEIPADQAYHRTHVTSWLRSHGHCVAASVPQDWNGHPEWRWTVDVPEDLRMMEALLQKLGGDWDLAEYPDIVEVLERHPEFVAINSHVRQKALADG